ncbi:MAG: hypothetical protein GVY30_00085 [Chloroflexi bacterium]|nr:hypothetical protein [Chloroflexota bacterium]
MIKTNKGEERERALLGLLRVSQRTQDLPTVPTPDRHLDAEDSQLKVAGLKFDFAWIKAGVLLELDGGQWLPGGGRHGSDNDRWKTMQAVAQGWRVIHISPAMVESEPARMLELLKSALDTDKTTPF